MLACVLRQRAGGPQLVAQFIRALYMDCAGFAGIIENNDAVGLEVAGAGDLHVPNVMLPHPWQYPLLHLVFYFDILVTKNV